MTNTKKPKSQWSPLFDHNPHFHNPISIFLFMNTIILWLLLERPWAQIMRYILLLLKCCSWQRMENQRGTCDETGLCTSLWCAHQMLRRNAWGKTLAKSACGRLSFCADWPHRHNRIKAAPPFERPLHIFKCKILSSESSELKISSHPAWPINSHTESVATDLAHSSNNNFRFAISMFCFSCKHLWLHQTTIIHRLRFLFWDEQQKNESAWVPLWCGVLQHIQKWSEHFVCITKSEVSWRSIWICGGQEQKHLLNTYINVVSSFVEIVCILWAGRCRFTASHLRFRRSLLHSAVF